MKKMMMVLVTIFLLLISVSFAYDTNNYSIDFPSSYHYASEGSYSSQEGYNINVKVVPYNNIMYYEDVYNDAQVKVAKDNIRVIVDYMRSGVVDSVKQRYPGMYTDEQLQYIADTVKVGTIYEAKIAKMSKNNYDSIMTLHSYYMLDIEYFVLTYSVSDKNNIYIITASGNTKDYFEKIDIKNALNSFTIKNYNPLQHKNINTSNEIKNETNKVNETNKTSNLCESENYSILMPESYSYSNEGSYSSKEGHNINIKVHKYSEYPEMANLESEAFYYEDIYNNEMVDEYKQNITSTFYNSKNNAAEKQKKKYEGQLSGKTIDSAYSTMEFGSIIASDVTTISSHKYPAIRIAYTFSLLGEKRCMWQYTIFDKTRVIGLSISGPDETYIGKGEIQKTIDSFTIKNYSPLENKTIQNQSNTSYKNSNSTSNKSDYDLFSFTNIMSLLLITLFAYMTIPLLIKLCNVEGFEPKKAQQVALWNSIVVGGFFFLISSSKGIHWSFAPALIYFIVNKAVLTRRIDASNDNKNTLTEEKKDKEEHNKDFSAMSNCEDISKEIQIQNPIDTSIQKEEIGSKEIPWELQENDCDYEKEEDKSYERNTTSNNKEAKNKNSIIEEAQNTISELKQITNIDKFSKINNELGQEEIKSELERIELLEKYQKLLNNGTITKEEFDKIKKKLLNFQ